MKTTGTMPALFLGHGNPMNAIDRNAYTEGWKAVASNLPRPPQVLSVSGSPLIDGGRARLRSRG